MGLIKKIFRGSGEGKDEISKFDDRTLIEKEIQLKNKSKEILNEIKGVDNEIDHLVEESKGKSKSEKKANASKIDTLVERKQALESASVAVSKELQTRDGVETVKIGDEISKMGIIGEIDNEKMNEAIVERRIKAQETDEKANNIKQNVSKSISSTKIGESTGKILDLLNEVDEGNLEPEQVAKQLSKDLE